MRKVFVSLVAAASVVAVASPAAAQYYNRAPVSYGYGYNNGYGHNNGAVRSLRMRVNRIQQNLQHLAQYRMISGNEYRNRQEDARDIERRLNRDARDGRGLNGQEIAQAEQRINRLEYRIQRDMHDGRNWSYR